MMKLSCTILSRLVHNVSLTRTVRHGMKYKVGRCTIQHRWLTSTTGSTTEDQKDKIDEVSVTPDLTDRTEGGVSDITEGNVSDRADGNVSDRTEEGVSDKTEENVSDRTDGNSDGTKGVVSDMTEADVSDKTESDILDSKKKEVEKEKSTKIKSKSQKATGVTVKDESVEKKERKATKTTDKEGKKTSKTAKSVDKSDKKTSKSIAGKLSHGSLRQHEIEELLQELKLKYQEGYTCFVANCLKFPVNKRPIEDKAIYINKTTGYFTCLNCKKHGLWTDLQKNFNAISNASTKGKFICFNDPLEDIGKVHDFLQNEEHVKDSLSKGVLLNDATGKPFSDIQKEFGFGHILKSIMVKHDITYDKETKSLLIPYKSPDLELTACRKLQLFVDEDSEETEIRQSFITKGEPISLFGWRDGDKEKTKLVLTLTEKDALAVQQTTSDYCVLSVPKESQLPQEVLPYLERFKTIILWLGCDMNSWLVTKQFARKLGKERCLLFRPSDSCPAPYEALKQKKSLDLMLNKAKPIKHEFITSFSEIRDDVLSEISHHEQVSGIKWQRFTQLNKLLKGFRPGELTVLTGRTGSGKTTFMSEYSLDLCTQGVNTLWGSFEVNNIKLAKTMMTQYSLKNLTLHLDEFEYFANEFEKLPMYFMTFFGQENIVKVIETMSHAVYIHDIQHVIVDNLQFMMGDEMFTQDKFTKQDKVYSAFRRFASIHNCHVSLVIHPRKENEDTDLTTSSIFGSAKATQEADNVILLQDKRIHSSGKGKKFIQITKNRFDGELGIMNLKFDTECLTFSNSHKKSEKKKQKKIEIEEKENFDLLEDD